MKTFQITEAQIASVIGAAAADELSRRFNRHFDFLTIAGWASPETPLREGGLELNEDETEACAKRIASFFDFDEARLINQSAERIADWTAVTARAIADKLHKFPLSLRLAMKETVPAFTALMRFFRMQQRRRICCMAVGACCHSWRLIAF